MVSSSMTRPQEALAVHQTNYFHSSTFVELGDGRILHAAGTAFCTSDDGGLTWSKPFSCVDKDGNRVGGSATSLVKLSGKGIGLAATLTAPDPGGRVEARRRNYLVFWRSEDGGETWESPVRVTPTGVGCHALQDVL
ncbi:MAG: exo-alpha-sialidase, partial [Planctomycetes bacterium]|nr:exo-alpha-sialidase [Planctomycetota bacterium]